MAINIEKLGDQFFENFSLEYIKISDITLRVRIGGSGFPILLLHGHPRTHTTWYKVAPLLAEHFTVVCPDLRGFGKSTIPNDTPDHRRSSKRQKALDCVMLMDQLGYNKFIVVGHDRGAYTAFRAAMDFPDRICKLVVLDAVPILEALERCTEKFAKAWWHWFFYLQKGKPERAINADPETWYAGEKDTMGERNYEDYLAAIHDPNVVHGMLEDYRAGIAIDRAHDQHDRDNGRVIQCPVMCLWAAKDDLAFLYGNVLNIWRHWANDLNGHAIQSGHHMAEEAPDELATALIGFINQGRNNDCT